ncbi:MAG TPA: L,D-transpeptidase [Candidatus Limnocylindria bacterium]|nr:L,D-transpeptidase [Candidatus Limnocylindria bacterium]
MGMLLGCLLLSLAGCSMELAAALFGPRHPPPAAEPPPPAVADEEVLPWAEKEPIFVVVRQSCRTLDVYRYGKRIRSYPAVFGQGGTPKLNEGDRRTPIGLYSIIGKRPHPRWGHFFLLDYPSASDVWRHQQAKAMGELDEAAGIGGEVGIHGTDKPDKNERGIDWTLGCVSVSNEAIEELDRLLPLGTPVSIEP